MYTKICVVYENVHVVGSIQHKKSSIRFTIVPERTLFRLQKTGNTINFVQRINVDSINNLKLHAQFFFLLQFILTTEKNDNILCSGFVRFHFI